VPSHRREILSPEEVLARFSGGPNTGIFTDGSCDPNPGPGGWGFVWVEDGEIIAQGSGYDPDTTNNRMELRALIEAYERLPADGLFTVYSDSQLCVNTINQWAAGWEKRGWKRKTGPIKNLDLVQRLWVLSKEKPSITLSWIKAHDGTRWNEYADALASSYQR
jgi:ribonuclease HI